MEVAAAEQGLPVRELVLVNAQRGNISLHFNQIDTAWSVQGGPDPVQGPDPTLTSPATETPIASQTPETAAVLPPAEETITAEEASPATDSAADVTALAGATWYVATTGNDANSCSAPASPCATIDGAIAKAATGDIIRVASGTYTNITGNVVTISKGVTLSGGWNSTFSSQNGASIIDGGGVRNGILVNSSGLTIVVEYFVIQNSYTGSDSGGIYVYGSNFSLKNSSVINNKAGARGAGVFMISGASLTDFSIIKVPVGH